MNYEPIKCNDILFFLREKCNDILKILPTESNFTLYETMFENM